MRRSGAVLMAALLGGCHLVDGDPGRRVDAGADPARGQRLLAQYQCGSCHRIPGVEAASALVGPPLDGFGARSYIAGHIPNRPETLAAWIVKPQALVPDTPMPSMGASPEDARDMAAFLLTLR
jgi:cytochrome c2